MATAEAQRGGYDGSRRQTWIATQDAKPAHTRESGKNAKEMSAQERRGAVRVQMRLQLCCELRAAAATDRASYFLRCSSALISFLLPSDSLFIESTHQHQTQ